MLKTAVVILNWNGLGFLKKFLGKIVLYSQNSETEVFVADNGSTDGSCDWITENFSDVKVIIFERNHGFAGGYNLALAQIEAQYYVIINSDIEVTGKWLIPLINHMDNNPDVASCQPKILSYINKDTFEYAGAAGGFIDKLGYPLCRGRILSKLEKDTGQYDNQSNIFWSTGACMVVRAEAWKRCRGFDSDFFAHMEEIDLCWRFHRAGYRVTYIPESTVFHVGGGTLPYNSPFKTYLNFRNSLFLLYKNLPEKNFKRTLLIRKVLDGLAALFFLCKGQIGSSISVWKAHMDYYKQSGKLKEKRLWTRGLGDNKSTTILNKVIVFEFYVRQNRTFTSLRTNF